MLKCLLLTLVFLCASANSETIELVVAASAGGPDDVLSRKIVERIEQKSDLHITIVNKPGAAHTIGYSYVQQRTKPTMIISTSSIIDHEVYKVITETYNFGNFQNIVFVNSKSGIRSMNDLMTLSKTRQINFGYGGVGTHSHRAMVKLCEDKLNCLQVPYKSGANAMLDLLVGSIDVYALVSYGSDGFLKNDKYTAISRITNENNWVKLFTKNMSDRDINTIRTILKELNPDFFIELGLIK